MSQVARIPSYGIDVDHAGRPEGLIASLRRRFEGRFPVDPFGADPMLMDAVAPFVRVAVRVEVEHGDRIPASGPAVLVANRGLGVLEPTALAVAVRMVVDRRLRVVNAPDVPVLGPLLRKLGAMGASAADLGAAMRAGHLVAVPLGNTWFRTGAGTPPLDLLTGAVGYPVLPVALRPAGPLGTPLRGWLVTIGRPIRVEPGLKPGDPLAAAELAEAAREGVEAVLAARRHPSAS